MSADLKYGFLDSADDSGALRSGTASWLGRDGQPIQLASLYGLIHNPPEGCQVLLLPQNGQESNSIGLPDHPSIRPLKDLKEGEVALVNYLTGAYVLFKENGDIEVSTSFNVTVNSRTAQVNAESHIGLTAPQIDVTGNFSVSTGATGTFTTPTGDTVTVVDGIITNIF
jgi:phage gp45-like